jgi:hypothetical protein
MSKNVCEYNNSNANFIILADENFLDQRKIDINTALAEWDIKTNNSLDYKIKFVDIKQFPNDLSGDNNTIKIYIFDPGFDKLGWTEWDIYENKARILIKPDISDDEFYPTILHELGHAFHLNHYNGKYKSIMHPLIGNTIKLECYDLKTFCKKWVCQIDCQLEEIENYDPKMDIENVCIDISIQ